MGFWMRRAPVAGVRDEICSVKPEKTIENHRLGLSTSEWRIAEPDNRWGLIGVR